MKNNFDTLIVITEKDFLRVKSQYDRLIKNMPGRKILFVGPAVLQDCITDSGLSEKAGFINENDILLFDTVHKVMAEHMKDRLGEQEMPRGVTGWYYQQFLKMEYAKKCKDDFYMSWDGDTIPCAPFEMHSKETEQPYLDLKHELHEEYFVTMSRLLPGMKKVIGKSFISEHMLFNSSIMKELIAAIEGNDDILGTQYWEKIIHSIEPERITKSAFSEFETYGAYVALHYPEMYKLRSWHSFRMAGDFFDINTICDRDYEWLSKDFYAISFEKWAELREDQKGLFDNPEYQSKLSARKMLEVAQEEFESGYIEVWD